jgi:hypothetical protein
MNGKDLALAWAWVAAVQGYCDQAPPAARSLPSPPLQALYDKQCVLRLALPFVSNGDSGGAGTMALWLHNLYLRAERSGTEALNEPLWLMAAIGSSQRLWATRVTSQADSSRHVAAVAFDGGQVLWDGAYTSDWSRWNRPRVCHSFSALIIMMLGDSGSA